MNDSMQIHSTVKAPLVKRALWRGSVTAVMGLFLLIWGGAFLPEEKLAVWGLLIFTLGFALITYGLVPYRRLSALQETPDLLLIDTENLSVLHKGNTTYTIPLRSIERCGHVDSEKDYGICLWFKDPMPEKIWVHDPKISLRWVMHKARRRKGCDLFLPYYSRRSYVQLAEILDPSD